MIRQHDKSQIAYAIVVTGIVLFAVGLRVKDLARESLWYDELVSFRQLDAASLPEYLERVRAEDAPMFPTYFVLQYGWSRVLGTSAYSIRLLSVACACVTILVVYALGASLHSRMAGCVAAVFLAMCEFHIYYSQEIRMYSLFVLASTLSVYCLHKSLTAERPVRWWAMALAANALLLTTHLMAVALLLAEALYCLVFWRRRLERVALWATSWCPGIVLACYWFTTLDTDKIDRMAAHITCPLPRELLRHLMVMYSGFMVFTPMSRRVVGLVPLFALGWCVYKALPALSGVQGVEPSTEDECRPRSYALVFLWCVVPPGALLLMTYAVRPCFSPRYVAHVAVPLSIALGQACVDLSRGRLGKLAVALSAVVLSAYGYYALTAPRPFRADTRGAAATIAEHLDPTDEVVVLPRLMQPALAFYSGMDEGHIQTADTFEGLRERVSRNTTSGKRSWLYVAHRPQSFQDKVQRWLDSECSATPHRLPGSSPAVLYLVSARGLPDGEATHNADDF